MAEILIAALSPVGHIGPLLNVARGLVDRGDRVTVLSGAGRADDIRATGATPTTLAAKGDLDLALLEADSGREKTSGIKRLNFDIIPLFVAPMPHQTKALSDLMSQTRFDAILADYGFFGVLPFVLGDQSARPQQPEPACALAHEVRCRLEARAVRDAAGRHEADLGRRRVPARLVRDLARALVVVAQDRQSGPLLTPPPQPERRDERREQRLRNTRARRQGRVEGTRELRDTGLLGDLLGDGGQIGEAEFEGSVHGFGRHGAGDWRIASGP